MEMFTLRLKEGGLLLRNKLYNTVSLKKPKVLEAPLAVCRAYISDKSEFKN